MADPARTLGPSEPELDGADTPLGSVESRVLENVRLAAGCGASPSMLLAVALSTARPSSVREGIELLQRLAPELERTIRETPRPHAALAELPPALRAEPEVGRMRLDVGDHELRGRLVFGDLLKRCSFIQVAALAIANVELSDSDAELLDHEGVLTQLADPRIWPLAVTRRIAASGGSLAEAVVGGLSSLCTEQMTVLPVAGFMRFLARVESGLAAGQSVEQTLRSALSRGEKIPGLGRPVLGTDERVPPKLALAARYGRDTGRNMRLCREIDELVQRAKGLRVNSAGYQAALLRDLGFSPESAAAFCLLYFVVPVLAHAVRQPTASSAHTSGFSRSSER